MVRRIICSILICSLLLGCISVSAYDYDVRQDNIVTASYSEEEWHLEGTITYPVTGKNQEWKEFQSHDEMVAACNMPTTLLKKASTTELVELMLDYPLLGDLLLFDNVASGLEIMSYRSNILAELLSRTDGASALLNVYGDFEIVDTALSEETLSSIASETLSIEECLKNQQLENKIEQDRKNLAQCIFLESVLTSDVVVGKLTDTEIEQLTKCAEEKVFNKEDSGIYSAYTYLFYELAQQVEVADKLGQIQRKVTIASSNNVTRDMTSTVRTPNGSNVPTIIRTYNEAEVLSTCEYIDESYPNVQILRSGTTNYNCHSYAWHSQSTSNVYWMNDPSLYFTDGSYTRVGTSPTATGQKVCYTLYALNNPYVHSGIVYSISGSTIMITSKWGSGYLVRHNATYSPYEGTRIYYRR